MITENKEQSIFGHAGSKIIIDREIDIMSKIEEPLIVILGNVLSNEECDELIRLSSDKSWNVQKLVQHMM